MFQLYDEEDTTGSIFDFGMFFMASEIIGIKKKIVVINPEDVQKTKGKSFQNVLLELI